MTTKALPTEFISQNSERLLEVFTQYSTNYPVENTPTVKSNINFWIQPLHHQTVILIPPLNHSNSPSEVTKRGVKCPYKCVVGSLMYLAMGTRPDIAFHASSLASYLQNPGPTQWQGVNYLLSYLNTTRDRGIKYSSESNSRTN